MNDRTLIFDVAEGVATLTLNRPDRLNSFNATLHEEMRAAMKTIERDDTIRCLLLTGAGRAFCAGQDLGDRDVSPDGEMPDLGDSLERNYNPLIRRIMRLEKPVVCAVNGVAAGAGANLALACDIVLAAQSAYFVQSFSNIGLIPDSGGSWLLPRLVGRARALAITLLAEKVSAQQAADWGMIWKALGDEELMPQAIRLAQRLAAGPTRGLGLLKRCMQLSSEQDLDAQLDSERDLQRLAGRSADYREGVAAFMEKRQPNFSGK
jgi:2-(1,2-epoxy-1,2-dihydrophenyl)acetyl-CoA isomerase